MMIVDKVKSKDLRLKIFLDSAKKLLFTLYSLLFTLNLGCLC
jgi:hypothetical protein